MSVCDIFYTIKTGPGALLWATNVNMPLAHQQLQAGSAIQLAAQPENDKLTRHLI
jgi:hypothetical protein